MIRQAEETERRRIGLHLHDHVGQNLTLARMRLSELHSATRPDEIREELDTLAELIEGALAATRQLSADLAAPTVHELGLEAALSSLCTRMRSDGPTSFRFVPAPPIGSIPKGLAAVLFRMVRELMFNVVKHASARNAEVRLQHEGNRLHLSVEDDGLGFDVSAAGTRRHGRTRIGLASIDETVGDLGGRMRIETGPGEGARITLSVPVPDLAGSGGGA